MEVLSIFLFILEISSLSLLFSVKYNKKSHETFIISSVFFTLLTFVFGFLKNLYLGFLASLIACLLIYAYSFYLIIKEKKVKQTITNFISLPFIGLILITVVFIIGLKGKVFVDTDELSHWGDIVKTMVQTNKFGSDPNSGSLFKSYPPGIALFQYLLEELHIKLFGSEFVEWLCYLALNILCVSSIISSSKSEFSIKGLFNTGLLFGIIFVLPFVLNDLAYITLYSELLIGFIICGLLINFVNYNTEDYFYDLRILSLITLLFIVKDTGLLFGLIGIVCYLIVLIKDKRLNIKNIALTLFTLLPRLIWQVDLTLNKVRNNFDNKIEINTLFNVLIGKDDSYRSEVLKAFKDELIYTGLRFTPLRIFVNYAILTIILVVLVYLVTRLSKSRYKKVTFGYALSSLVLYLISTLIMYLFKMSESEALMIASFYRYYSIIIYGLGLFIFIELANLIFNLDKSILISLILGAVVLVLLPNINPYVFIRGNFSKACQEIRHNYDEIVENTNKYANGESKIWFISEGGSGEDRLSYKFLVRPNVVDGDGSIRTIEDYDDVSVKYSKEEWMKELIEKGYDFVAIYSYDDEFHDDYKELFKDENIKDDKLYSIDRINKQLVMCE